MVTLATEEPLTLPSPQKGEGCWSSRRQSMLAPRRIIAGGVAACAARESVLGFAPEEPLSLLSPRLVARGGRLGSNGGPLPRGEGDVSERLRASERKGGRS